VSRIWRKKGDGLIRKVAKANAILLLQYAVGSLVPLLLVPHIVRVIGLAEYGHLAVLMAWGGYGAVIVQYAFQMTGPKRVMHLAADESIASVFVDIVFAKFILLFIVIPVMAVFALVSVPSESTSSFAWILLFAMPIAAGLNSVWFLQAQDHFLSVCILAIAGSLLTLFIGFSFVNSSNHRALDFAVVVSVFGAIFIGIGTLLLAITSIKSEKYEWNITRAISALKEGRHLFISQFVSMLYTASGPIVINYLLDAKAAGAYSVTERVINALMAAALLTHTAAYPRLASAYINNRVEYWRMLKFILTVYLSVTLIIAVLAWSLREPVVRFLYSEVSSDHYGLLFFGLAWLVLGIFGTALTGYLTVSGRSSEVWPLTLKILVLSVAAGVPGVFLFGSVGWMAALVLSMIVVLHTGFRHWRREYGK
jgi:PST family polysaccharide transporter